MDREPAQPVFFHSGWRTGSTFVWSRLRQLPRALAFYEIFHEQLATLRADTISDGAPDAWSSKHPSFSSYMSEYVPLLGPDGGIPGYDASMAYELFLPSGGMGGQLTTGEVDHVRKLINHAHALEKVPVLTCTRTLGRIGALKATFGGRHILNFRNPFHQWASYSEQEWLGNSYFFRSTRKHIEAASSDDIIRKLSQLFDAENFNASNPASFFLMVGFYLYLSGRAASQVDAVIDIDRLASDPACRARTERVIADFGLDVDLSEAKRSFAFSVCEFGPRHQVAEWLNVISDLLLSSDMDRQGKSLIRQALADVETEVAQFEFYAGPFRRAALSRLQAANENGKQQRERAEALAVTCEQHEGALAAEQARVHELVGSFEAARSEAANLAQEREALVKACEEREGALFAEQGRAHQLERSLEALRGEAAELTSARDALAAEVEELRQSLSIQGETLEARGALCGALQARISELQKPIFRRLLPRLLTRIGLWRRRASNYADAGAPR